MWIKKITDADVDSGDSIYQKRVNRYGARGLLFDEANRIALLLMDQNGYHKLPGGGIEESETPEEAFCREIKEETGCLCKIIDKIGIVEEHKGHNHFLHVSYCYAARKLSECRKLSFTENEKELGFHLVWMTYDNALEIMKRDYNNCNDYDKKFMLFRELCILEKVRQIVKYN